MQLFRSEEHVKGGGEFMSTRQIWRLADTWYNDRTDPAWRRRTAEEAEAVFAGIGLTGEFWRLT